MFYNIFENRLRHFKSLNLFLMSEVKNKVNVFPPYIVYEIQRSMYTDPNAAPACERDSAMNVCPTRKRWRRANSYQCDNHVKSVSQKVL